jgi:transposase-like protein
MRNFIAAARKPARQIIAALIRTIFVQPDHASASAQLREVVGRLEATDPEVAARLEAAEADLLAYTAFPPAHWSKIWSNNPIERLNRELKRRTDVVQIFPNTESVIRLIGALLVEVNDEMLASNRRYIAAASVADITPVDQPLPSTPELTE